MAAYVTTQQPMSGQLVCTVDGQRDWNSGLLGCCEDCCSLLRTFCCLPCAICNIATRTGECCLTPFCVPGSLVALRARIRTLGGIRGSICNDCLALTCCNLCAICQMQRELDNMGL